MIAAVGIVKDEADIIEAWISHTLGEGIDRIYLADGCSTDGTRQILDEADGVMVFTDSDQFVQQVKWTNCLAGIAHDEGAEWILPIDVDEFWYATEGETIAKALKDCCSDKLYARSYQHLDWETRQEAPKRLRKVAFRWQPGAEIAIGNHNVSIPGGDEGVLDLRELQFRSFDHFCAKTEARNDALDPSLKATGAGAHYSRLEGFTTEQMRVEWELMLSIPTVHDPVPSSSQSLVRSLISTPVSTLSDGRPLAIT